MHKQRVGPLKTEAVRTYHERRNRAQREPGWCPEAEHQRAIVSAQADREREARRQTFETYAPEYLAWAKLRHRGYRTTRSQVNRLVGVFGPSMLDEINTASIEQHLAALEMDGASHVTVTATEIGCRRCSSALSGSA